MELTSLDEFLSEAHYGRSLTNKQIVENINSLNGDDPDYTEKLTRQLVFLATAKPKILRLVKISPNTAWHKYMTDNNISRSHSMMSYVIKMLDKSVINEWILELYEDNEPNVRSFVHHLNSLDGSNKVPFLYTLLKSLSRLIYDSPLISKIMLLDLINNPTTTECISMFIEQNKLKTLSGETMTNPNIYKWICDEFNIDWNFIQSSDVGYDLGGGYGTPHLSKFFKKELCSLDLINPANALTGLYIINHLKEMPTEQYQQEIKKQQWEYFDVFTDHINDSYATYFITSFGFITSTVAPTNKKGTWLNTTYNGIKRIAELIGKGKSVYFILYGRPSVRVHRNKIISFKFENKKPTFTEILEDNYGTNKNSFGVSVQML